MFIGTSLSRSDGQLSERRLKAGSRTDPTENRRHADFQDSPAHSSNWIRREPKRPGRAWRGRCETRSLCLVPHHSRWSRASRGASHPSALGRGCRVCPPDVPPQNTIGEGGGTGSQRQPRRKKSSQRGSTTRATKSVCFAYFLSHRWGCPGCRCFALNPLSRTK
jgi:hypothetical protein